MDTVALQRPGRLFGQSMAISAVRCTLSYLVLPFVLPLVGLTAGLDAGVGLVVGPVAMAANMLAIRRFWVVDHRYKVPASTLNSIMILALLVLFVGDLRAVFL